MTEAKASVRRVTPRASALSGTLADLPLPDLLGFLVRSGGRGVLTLTGPVPATIELDAGRVAFAETEGDPSIEAHLRSAGIDDDLVTTAERAASRGLPLSDALVDGGAATVDLRAVLYEHTVNTLFELLGAPDDHFLFDPEGRGRVGSRFSVELEPLLADADRRRRSWATIATSVPSTAVVLRWTRNLGKDAPSVTVTADDWTILSRLDGTQSLADVVREVGRTSFSVCEAAHRLIGAGLLEPA